MWKKLSTWTLLAVFSLLIVKGISQDLDLADAFDDDIPPMATQPPKVDPAGGAGGAVKPSPKPAKPTVKEPAKAKPKQTEETYTDFFDATIRPALLPRTTHNPLRTSVAPRKVQSGPGDFDLADALDSDNDIRGKGKDSGKGDKDFGEGGRDDGRPNSRGGNEFSDDDLLGVADDKTYNPDKGKGGKRGSSIGGDVDPADDNNYDTMAETGTIAGIVSAVGMALVGAVSGYISYQKKKLCFSIQQSLNADMVKADAPDAVVAQEPQVQQTLLQPPNAEPPTEENVV